MAYQLNFLACPLLFRKACMMPLYHCRWPTTSKDHTPCPGCKMLCLPFIDSVTLNWYFFRSNFQCHKPLLKTEVDSEGLAWGDSRSKGKRFFKNKPTTIPTPTPSCRQALCIPSHDSDPVETDHLCSRDIGLLSFGVLFQACCVGVAASVYLCSIFLYRRVDI